LYQGSKDKVLGMEFSISTTIPPTPEAPDHPLCYETTIAVKFLYTVIAGIYLRM
jgi:hypothetical protein